MKYNLVVVSDIEHSAPRLTNLVHFLPNEKFKKYWISANANEKITKDDLPQDFLKNLYFLQFDRKINIFSYFKKLTVKNKLDNSNPTLSSKPTKRTSIKASLIKLFLSINFPDQYIFTLGRYLKIFSKLNLENSNTIVLSSNPYPTSIVTGYFLKKKYKIKWVVDYRDLWSQNHNYPFSRLRKFFDYQLEKRLIKKADLILTVSQELKNKINNKFKIGSKVKVVYNGYSPIEKKKNLNLKDFTFLNTNKIKILHVGSIYPQFQQIELMLNQNFNNSEFELHFIGNVSLSLDPLVNKKNKDYIKQIGVYDRQTTVSLINEYDYLIFFDSLQHKGVLPLKVFEYINSNKPIICVGGNIENEIQVVLRKYKKCYFLKEKIEIIDFFEKLKINNEYYNNEKLIERFSYKNISKEFNTCLNSII